MRTHCLHGHALTPENAYIRRRGYLGCRTCKNNSAAKYRPKPKTPEERFWAKVERLPSGCWIWRGSKDKGGYGKVRINSRDFFAHRVSYTWRHGSVPDGLCLDHLCRVRACVNPDHLEAVTLAENISRGTQGHNHASKTHCPKGHPYDAANTYHDYHSGGRKCKTCVYGKMAEKRRAKGVPIRGVMAAVCRNGHAMIPENQRQTKRGIICRTCAIEGAKRHYEKVRREKAKAATTAKP
jgi:hypothetical protein